MEKIISFESSPDHYHADACIMVHNQCLACGGIDDRTYYVNLLLQAGGKLKAALPEKTIILIFADFDGLYIVDDDEQIAHPRALAAELVGAVA
jgi:hypothetical protein